MKMRTMLVGVAACLFAASAANAVVVFNATTTTTANRPLNALQVGDTITIDVRMANPTAVAIFGVGAGVESWNSTVVGFVSGLANAGPYFCTTTACTAGLNNGLSFDTDADGNFIIAPSDVQVISGGTGNYFPIVQAIATTGRAGNGTRDPGLDLVVNGGGAQFRVVFSALAQGSTNIVIGTDPNPIIGNVIALAGGASAEATNAVIAITVPEPGAALAGLGAIGFAVAAAGLRRRMSI